jgi:glycosyltransferase involved in cell wall biosynthesis
VATRTGALPEVLGEAAEWAAVDDVTSVARALHTVLTEPARAAAIVAAGAERLATFSWDRTADGVVELYQRVAAAR